MRASTQACCTCGKTCRTKGKSGVLDGCSTSSSTDSSSPAFGGAGRSAPRLLLVLEKVEQPAGTLDFPCVQQGFLQVEQACALARAGSHSSFCNGRYFVLLRRFV